MIQRLRQTEPPVDRDLDSELRQFATPLQSDDDLTPLLERIGDARYVLLGEASHGTAEYYSWRTRISRRLIEEKGFDFIAVEGDWPDCYRLNRYIKGFQDAGASARDVLHAFERWPTWMWANEEIVALAEWLRHRNERLPAARKTGFYGLDVYSLWDSLHSLMAYLRRSRPEAFEQAVHAFRCFEPYGEDPQEYAWATRFVDASCEDEVVALLAEIRRGAPHYADDGRESDLNAEQNAIVVKDAEHYYRTMVHGGPESWNIRDRHMVETLERLMRHHGPQAKAIVWEHNTHIGDARYTDMSDEGMVNVGQLVRQQREREDVVLVGFGSHRGSVIAGSSWEAPMARMPVPPARHDSWEDVLHRMGPENRLLIFNRDTPGEAMLRPRGHRAIGVVYHPRHEMLGNYVPTVLPRRYDAFLYLDETTALHPLRVPVETKREVPDTFPAGV